MNTYDQKHFMLLRQITAGDWQGIPEEDAPELRVLMVCKYLRVEKDSGCRDQIVITTEGEHYYHHLSNLFAMSLISLNSSSASENSSR